MEGHEMAKLTAYRRVSSQGQVTDGNGLPVQERRLRADAKARGHRIIGWETDPGITGTVDEAGRPGIMNALRAIRSGQSEGLYLTDLGRLSRLLTIQEAILAKVWEYGGIVVTVESGEVMRDDPDDPMRTAMRQMAGVFYQLEKAMIVKRLRNGREYKASIGGHACGAAPFGTVAVDGELVTAEAERIAISRMRELRDGGASLRQIVSALESEGHRTKRGARWHPATVARILAAAAA
jgi:DNA invertase Pin-like site-specific DNA recombinase